MCGGIFDQACKIISMYSYSYSSTIAAHALAYTCLHNIYTYII